MNVKILVGLVLLCPLFKYPASGQAPLLKCLAVDASGNVQLSWLQPSDSCGAFYNYYVYYSTAASGPYSLIDSIANYNVTTYYHTGANADQNPGFYFLQCNSACLNNISDTLSTVFLSVNNTPGGVADLLWNDLHAPTALPSTDSIRILRENPITGLLQPIHSDSLLTAYRDSFTTCSDSIRYQVYLLDSSGCFSSSNISVLPPDIVPPKYVSIDSVSVDMASGLATIGWQASASADIAGYILYVANAFGGWDSIGMVSGSGTTFFTDIASVPDTQSILYDVIAIDSCGNKSASTSGHSTLTLKVTLDTCRGDATLEWNPYFLWPSGVSGNDVFISQNGGAFVYEGATTATQYTYTGVNRSTTYCYFIRAGNGLLSKTSTSNIVCAYTDTSATSGLAFTLAAETHDSVINELIWTEDPAWSTLIGSYRVYRSIDGGGFSLIGTVPFGTTRYEDNLEPLWEYISGEGAFCYFVVPVKITPTLYGCIDTSNIACVSQYPKFIVPNTFTPNGDGRNDVFMPVRVFIGKDNYLLIIYNRWGQKIFESTDITEGWDGYVKGFPVQNDAYVYHVYFTIRGGIPIQKAGTVVLLR